MRSLVAILILLCAGCAATSGQGPGPDQMTLIAKSEVTAFYQWLSKSGRLLTPMWTDPAWVELDPDTLEPIEHVPPTPQEIQESPVLLKHLKEWLALPPEERLEV